MIRYVRIVLAVVACLFGSARAAVPICAVPADHAATMAAVEVLVSRALGTSGAGPAETVSSDDRPALLQAWFTYQLTDVETEFPLFLQRVEEVRTMAVREGSLRYRRLAELSRRMADGYGTDPAGTYQTMRSAWTAVERPDDWMVRAEAMRLGGLLALVQGFQGQAELLSERALALAAGDTAEHAAMRYLVRASQLTGRGPCGAALDRVNDVASLLDDSLRLGVPFPRDSALYNLGIWLVRARFVDAAILLYGAWERALPADPGRAGFAPLAGGALALFTRGDVAAAADKATRALAILPTPPSYTAMRLHLIRAEQAFAEGRQADAQAAIAAADAGRPPGEDPQFDRTRAYHGARIAIAGGDPQVAVANLGDLWAGISWAISSRVGEEATLLKDMFDADLSKVEAQRAASEARLAQSEAEATLARGLLASAVLGVALLGGLVALLWRRAAERKRSNVLLAAKSAEIERQAVRLQAAFEERGVLLREIEHRVTNNLNVISSLLNMQIRRLEQAGGGATPVAVVREIDSRIHAMALIHRALTRKEEERPALAIAPVIQDLARYLDDLFGAEVVSACRGDGVEVDAGVAVSLGLIVCELLSNAHEHAQLGPGDRLEVLFAHTADGLVEMRVEDSGKGLPPEVEADRPHSLGLTVVSDLVRQIRGRLSVSPGCPGSGRPGTHWRVVFPPDLGDRLESRGAVPPGDRLPVPLVAE